MATYMNSSGGCRPSRRTIAAGASLAPSTVQRMVSDHLIGVWLEAAIHDPTARRIDGRSATYRALIPNLTELTGQLPDRCGESGNHAELTHNLTDSSADLTRQVGHEPELQPVEPSPLPPTRGGMSSRATSTNPRAVAKEMRIAAVRAAFCCECETGGGLHSVDCPSVLGSVRA